MPCYNATPPVLRQTKRRQGHTQPPEPGQGCAGLGAGQEKVSPHRLRLNQDSLAFPLRDHCRGCGGLSGHLAQLSQLTAWQSEQQKGAAWSQVTKAQFYSSSAAAPSLLKHLLTPMHLHTSAQVGPWGSPCCLLCLPHPHPAAREPPPRPTCSLPASMGVQASQPELGVPALRGAVWKHS